MTTVALVGAGGKMGCRITDNMKKIRLPRCCTSSRRPAGRANCPAAASRRTPRHERCRGRRRRPGRAGQPREAIRPRSCRS